MSGKQHSLNMTMLDGIDDDSTYVYSGNTDNYDMFLILPITLKKKVRMFFEKHVLHILIFLLCINTIRMLI